MRRKHGGGSLSPNRSTAIRGTPRREKPYREIAKRTPALGTLHAWRNRLSFAENTPESAKNRTRPITNDPDLAPFDDEPQPDDEDQELRDLVASELRAERWLITAEEDALIRRFTDISLRLRQAEYALDQGFVDIKAALEAARLNKVHLTGLTSEQFNRLMDYQQDLSEQWFRALQELQDYRLAHPMDESLGMITPSPPWLN